MPFASTDNDLTTLAALKAWLQIPNGEILAVNVGAGGSGYGAGTAVSFVGAGSGASALPVIVGGVITGIMVIGTGSGYLPTTTVSITGGGGSGATASIPAAGVTAIDNAADPFLSRLISAASNAILRYIGRAALKSQAYTETRDGHGGSRLTCRNYPVTAVTSVSVDGVAVPASVAGSAGYTFDQDGINLIGSVFTQGLSNVSLSYTAGYTPGSSHELNVLEQACLELCAQKWVRRGHVDQSSVSQNGGSMVFSQRDMPAEVKSLIQSFKSVALL